jgi:hypothetical protein
LGLDRSFETKSFRELGFHSLFSKKLKQLSSSLLGWVRQNAFKAGNRPLRIISKPTSLSGISTRIVSEGQRTAFIAQWDVGILGQAI